ncbi:MAG: hypothetical protein ACXVDD_09160 [Polyangia bacterium]
MTTVILLVVVSLLIAGFSYFTNAGFGDRKPPDKKQPQKDQASAGTEEPPPHK